MDQQTGEQVAVVRFSRDPGTARIETLKSATDYHASDTAKVLEYPPEPFGPFSVICIAFSIVTYVLDLGLVCFLLYLYIDQKEMTLFFITLIFVLVPAILMSAISFRWYIIDHDDPSQPRPSLPTWSLRLIFLLLHLAPLLRYVDTLIYGVRCSIARTAQLEQRAQALHRRWLDEDTNASLLRLFHTFVHAAPQAIIQLTVLVRSLEGGGGKIVGRELDIVTVQSWLVLAALLSIGWSLTCYHRSVRFARDDKEKVSWVGTLVAFCWHFTSAVGRVLALSLLAAVYPVWMACVCAVHWGVMTAWLALGSHQTAACGNRCEELLLSTALGLAYVLAFLAPRDGQTRYVYLAYYLVCLMENTGALVVWCVTNNSADNPYLYYGAVGGQIGAFLLGLIFLYIYYAGCHPSTKYRRKFSLQTAIPGMPFAHAQQQPPSSGGSSGTTIGVVTSASVSSTASTSKNTGMVVQYRSQGNGSGGTAT